MCEPGEGTPSPARGSEKGACRNGCWWGKEQRTKGVLFAKNLNHDEESILTEAAAPTGARPAGSGVRVLPLGGARTLAEPGGTPAQGGLGSDLARDPRGGGRAFFLLSGRGPVFDPGKPFEIGFALPSFTPSLVRFEVHGDALVRGAEIEFHAIGGRRLSGLPNPPGEGGTGETPVTWDARPLPLDRDGVHPRGLVAMRDGTFWVADSYGPHLLYVDATGRVLLRFNPFDRIRRLPRVLARRAPNRGFAGLTVTPDEGTLVAIMQGPLENPARETAEGSRIARIVTFDIATGTTRQYLYPQEDVALSNSAILALTDTSFLVVERDALLPGDARRPAWIKRIFRIEIDDATDVSDPADGEMGRMVGGRTVEERAPEELAEAGIRLVRKDLAVDLLALGYPHDKPEGLALFDEGTLAVLNDDDFGIASTGRPGAERVAPKILPRTDRVSAAELWLIPLPDGIAPHS